MDKSMIYGLGGLIVGALISWLIASNQTVPQTPVQHDMNQHGMTMTDMVDSLKGKTGDDFDKAFVSEMIEHHQGAIDMAKLAQQSAKHDEIKKMADDIISAQSTEIDQMKEWQKSWGY